MFNEIIHINGNPIGKNNPPYIVAEIGLNHNNDIEIGKKTIQAAARAGTNAVKFQSYIAEEFIDIGNPEVKFLFDIFKQYELSEKSHLKLQQIATDEGLDFFSTPLCVTSLDMLVSMGVPAIKIASGDIVNAELLSRAVSTKIPLIVSTGAAELAEILRTLQFLNENNLTNLCLMYCVSLYPTPPEKLNLTNISLFKELSPAPVGFSDHSLGSEAAMIATSLGSSIIEKHFTLDKSLPGPDHTISANPGEMTNMVKQVKLSWSMLGEKRYSPSPEEKKGRFLGRRSLYNHVKGKIIAMRPDLSIENPEIASSWDYLRTVNKTCSIQKNNQPYFIKKS